MRRAETNDEQSAASADSTDTRDTRDTRRPYEAPRVLIKRSVAAATLLTAKGPMSSGLTASG